MSLQYLSKSKVIWCRKEINLSKIEFLIDHETFRYSNKNKSYFQI